MLVNVQARELGLGSGGFDVLYANLTRGLELPPDDGAHVMALPYAPGQWAVRHVEEDVLLPESLDGLPVLLCTVHSQVAPACAGLAGVRVAYVQVPGRFTRGVAVACPARAQGAQAGRGDRGCRAVLRRRRALSLDRLGAALGRDSRRRRALLGRSRARRHRDALRPRRRCARGGGTRRVRARGAGAARTRVSQADSRGRHRGVSHHTRSVLELAGGTAALAPAEAEGWREACAGLPLEHMGRGVDEDAPHFEAAFAAGVEARRLLGARR